MWAEVIDTGRQVGKIATDKVQIDVVQRTGIRGGAEVHLPAGIGAALGDSRGKEQQGREHR